MGYNHFYKYLISTINLRLMNISGKVYSMIEMDGLAQAHVSRILAAMDIAQQLEWAPGLSLEWRQHWTRI